VFVCPFCGEKLRGTAALVAHVKRLHIDGPLCPACGLKYKNTVSLAMHASYHLDDPQHAALYLALVTNTRHKANLNKKKAWNTIRGVRTVLVARPGP